MNKYEFYSKLLQEDFPVKYRQDFAEHDSEQCKKISDLKCQMAEAVGLYLKVRHIVIDAANLAGNEKYHAIDDAFMSLSLHTQAEQKS